MSQNIRPAQSIGVALAMVTMCIVRADDWPQFRGPNCSGISSTDAKLPIEFSHEKNVKWSVELGDGIGSPVIAGGRVFVSAMVDEETVGLYAFDVHSGDLLWRRSWATGQLPEVHQTNSHASTTPAADDKRVYFYFSSLGMLSVDAVTGRDIWRCKLPKPFFVFKWGPGMSPVVHGDAVIFCQDDDLNPAIYAIDKRTGRIRWKDDRSNMAVNYSHPVSVETTHGAEIVVAGTGMLVGYDPISGERLWHAKTLLRNIKTTPVVSGDTLYVSVQSSGIANQWLATADQTDTGNNDGKLSKAEMQASLGDVPIPNRFYAKTFDRADSNGDGVLEGAELDKAFLHPDNFAGARHNAKNPADQLIVAVRAGGRGDVTETHVLWKHATKYTDHIVSPFVRDDRMLLIKRGGITTVFETKTGSPLRNATRLPNSGDYYASPVFGDGKIYIAGENGKIIVLEDSASYRVLASNDMNDSIIATPAIADGNIVIRTRTNLFCIGLN